MFRTEVPHKSDQLWGAVSLCLIAFGVLCCVWPASTRSPVDQKLREASLALSFGDHARANDLANEVLHEHPHSSHALLIAGEANTALQKPQRAIDYFSRVPEVDRANWLHAQFGKAERLMWLGHARDAEKLFRRVLQDNPAHIGANRSLSFLLHVQGRTWEAVPMARRLIQLGHFRGDQIQMAAATEQFFAKDVLFTRKCLNAEPGDPLPLLGEARMKLLRNVFDQAEELLLQVCDAHADVLEARGRLGRLLLARGRWGELSDWQVGLPPEADEHPEIWFVRGRFLQHLQQPREAARCFSEVLSRSPNHVEATWQLSQTLSQLGLATESDQVGRRSAVLAKIELTLSELHTGATEEKMHEAAGLFASINRYWEATAMCYVAANILRTPPAWAITDQKAYANLLHSDLSFSETQSWPFPFLSPDQFPRPSSYREKSGQAGQLSTSKASECRVRFEDTAAAVHLDFSYFNGTVKFEKGLEHIFETTGGGVAALDFDADLWPDLFFPQGSHLWDAKSSEVHLDRLFRNLGAERFVDVTELCGIQDPHFGQGAAVGDFNNDGFPDLYVGNLGPNRLLINNGDGTFSDQTEKAGISDDDWTLSCLIADLNGDFLPDLYSVNYLEQQAVYARRCKKNGQPLTCAPTLFPAQDDRLYLNEGNGRFRDVSTTSGIVCPDGKGLAMAAIRIGEDARLSLFIGNDTTNNFFFRNQTAQPGGLPFFSEDGVVSGLAADGNGRAQATMGVAVDDADGDGTTDIFVTSFIHEPSTLYLQQSEGIFVDSTRRARLHEPTYEMLGFGSQFIDGELDGWPDLVVTNGHVDRTWATGEPDVMPLQYFQNQGQAIFSEIRSDVLGDCFAQKHLGRALTRLDWNRDGKDDFCVSFLDRPVALVTNRTEEVGNRVVVRLIGVESDRDAIGAIVKLTAGKKSWTKQLTAGDGYLSSNERRLTFGLDTLVAGDSLSVTWPSGRITVVESVPVNTLITIVEPAERRTKPDQTPFPQLRDD